MAHAGSRPRADSMCSMERLLLLWDEMDELVGFGRLTMVISLAGLADATRRIRTEVAGATAAAGNWLAARNPA